MKAILTETSSISGMLLVTVCNVDKITTHPSYLIEEYSDDLLKKYENLPKHGRIIFNEIK